MTTAVFPNPTYSLKKITLPTEHGGWGIVGEPIALAVILAPSTPAFLVALAALGAFLARQPVKIFLGDLNRGTLYPRSRAAGMVGLGFLLFALVAIAGAVSVAGSDLLWPCLFALPFAAVQVVFDAVNESRRALPEICGAIAMGAVVTTMAMASGWGAAAYFLWLLMLCRSVPAIVFVRTRLRLDKGRSPHVTAAIALHVAAMTIVIGFASLGYTPMVVVIPFVVLLLRAAWGLSPWRPVMKAKQLGFTEVGFGVLTVVLIGAGYV